jgi:hypothetical protein
MKEKPESRGRGRTDANGDADADGDRTPQSINLCIVRVPTFTAFLASTVQGRTVSDLARLCPMKAHSAGGHA